MMRIEGPVGEIAGNLLDEVPDVVQQRGHDEALRRAGGLREIGGLQCVFGHRDALSEICVRTTLAEDRENLVGNVHERTPG